MHALAKSFRLAFFKATLLEGKLQLDARAQGCVCILLLLGSNAET